MIAPSAEVDDDFLLNFEWLHEFDGHHSSITSRIQNMLLVQSVKKHLNMYQ